jgi:CheY-like chemotaxis protein
VPTRDEAIVCRVLVIDDEPAIARAIERILEPEHSVVSVTSGSRALELLGKDAKFDVILCDVHIPDTPGSEIVNHLRATAPWLVSRVIFMTGGAFTEESQRLVSTSGLRVIQKPFDPDKLRLLIAEHRAAP